MEKPSDRAARRDQKTRRKPHLAFQGPERARGAQSREALGLPALDATFDDENFFMAHPRQVRCRGLRAPSGLAQNVNLSAFLKVRRGARKPRQRQGPDAFDGLGADFPGFAHVDGQATRDEGFFQSLRRNGLDVRHDGSFIYDIFVIDCEGETVKVV